MRNSWISKTLKSSLVITCMTVVSPSNAALIERADGMYYDTVNNLTWLLDANYAFSSGWSKVNANESLNDTSWAVNENGTMGWNAAEQFVSALEINGYSNWRLPVVNVQANNGGCAWSYSGTDCGYHVNTQYSEMASIFYDVLDLPAYRNADGSLNNSHDISWNKTIDNDYFENLMGFHYWLSPEYALDADYAWYFQNFSGVQGVTEKNYNAYVWAVHDGDIGKHITSALPVSMPSTPATVSAPPSLWLLFMAFTGLFLRKARKS